MEWKAIVGILHIWMWSQILRFWYFVCLSIFLFLCTSCCADIAREKWSNLFVFLLKQFGIQQGWGSQKYFWCLDLFSLNFECYFSLSVKNAFCYEQGLYTQWALYQRNRRHSDLRFVKKFTRPDFWAKNFTH